MAVADARLLVASPVRTLLPYGLLSVAQLIDEADVHWRNGVRFEPDTCQSSEIIVTGCSPPPPTKVATETHGLRGSNPFTVYTMPVCSPVGEDARQRAVAALTSGEARTVEREFWTGENGVTPHLAEDTGVTGTGGEVEQSAATVIVTGAVDVVEGLALLEESLSECYGNEGVIHVPRSVLTHMASQALVQRDGARLRTPSGHLVAAGAGYPGTSPAGAAPPAGTRWIYGTGAVFIHRTAIETPAVRPAEVVNRSTNDVFLVAERTYVIGWDCCHFAIPISITGVPAGTLGA